MLDLWTDRDQCKEQVMVLKKSRLLTIFFVAVAVTALVTIFISSPKFEGFENGLDEYRFENEWLVEKTGDAAQIPAYAVKGEDIELCAYLPKELDTDTCLYLETGMNAALVDVDGKSIAPIGGVMLLDTGGANPWQAFEIPADAGGKRITVRVIKEGARTYAKLYTILLGSRGGIRSALLEKAMTMISLAVMLMLMSAIIFLTKLLLIRHSMSRISIGLGSLAMFIFIAAIWFFADSAVQGACFIDAPSFFLLRIFSFVLLPPAFLLFMQHSCRELRKTAAALVFCELTVIGAALILLVLCGFELKSFLIFSHIGLVLADVLALIICLRERIKGRRGLMADVLYGLLVVTATGIADLISYYIPGNMHDNVFDMFGVLVFIIVLSAGALHSSVDFFERSQGFERLTRSLPCGIIKLSPELNVLFLNEYFCSMIGCEPDIAPGSKALSDIIVEEDMPGFISQYTSALEDDRSSFEAEMRHRDEDGGELWILAQCSICPDGLITAVGVDITARKKAEEQLRLSEEEYRIVVSHSKREIHRYDIKKKKLYLSKNSSNLFGLPEVVDNAPESIIEAGLIAEESVDAHAAFYTSMLSGEPTGTMVAKGRLATGESVWQRAYYTLVLGADGKPARAVISFEDVTEQHELEMASEKWRQSYALLDKSGMNYYEFNLTENTFDREEGGMLPKLPDTVPGNINAVMGVLAETSIFGEDKRNLTDFCDRARLIGCYERNLRSDKLQVRRVSDGGDPLWTEIGVQLVPDPYSNDLMCFILCLDIDEQKRSELMLEERSKRDSLTGLFNRRTFVELLDELLTSGTAEGAVVMLDVDCFKLVNDTFGHKAGDEVLCATAGRMRDMVRLSKRELMCRIGGDEFIMYLDGDKEDILARLEVLRDSMRTDLGCGVSTSCSVGVAFYSGTGGSFEELYEHADRALYVSKQGGKDRLTVYSA